MEEFFRSGDIVVPRPKGLDYSLENGKVYTLKYDNWEGKTFLEIKDNNKLTLPETIYKSDSDVRFINRILSYHRTSVKNTTGVLLTGLKGSGKTMMSKVIAKYSNLPIIIVDSSCPTRVIERFFENNSSIEKCIIFDEIDKNKKYWNTEDLLGFLDGVSNTGKKLVILTCNSDSDLNNFILDRCSRIRYVRKFDNMNKDSVKNIVEKFVTKNVDEVTDFIYNNFKVISYDNVISFLEEYSVSETKDCIEVVLDLNISLK